MADILHDFPIRAPIERVFEAISTPSGLDQWWTERSTGSPEPGAVYELWFGPGDAWRAVVARCDPATLFELQLVKADDDWTGSMVGFALRREAESTAVSFAHRSWPSANAHYRSSSFCWAMYLRVLRRYLEEGETVPYARRLDV